MESGGTGRSTRECGLVARQRDGRPGGLSYSTGQAENAAQRNSEGEKAEEETHADGIARKMGGREDLIVVTKGSNKAQFRDRQVL